MIEERSKTSHSILYAINRALENLGAPIELLCIVGSYGDTLEDEEVLEMLEEYNKNGTCMKEVICSVYDTPGERRKRFKIATT